jgi:O-antigen/teichoic acid export membrane protein
VSEPVNSFPAVAAPGWRIWERLRGVLARDFSQKVMATYATRVLLIAMGLVATVMITRALGPEGRGFFAVANAIAALGVQFGTFGLHASNTYYVAQDRSRLPALLGNSLVVSFGVSGAGALIVFAIFSLFPNLAPVHGVLLVLALAWIPFGLAYLLAQNLLLGIGEIGAFNRVEIANRLIAMVAIGVLIILRLAHPAFVFAAFLVAMVTTLVWMLFRLEHVAGARPGPSMPLFKSNIAYGLKVYIAGFFTFLVLRADLLMVQYMKGAVQTGYYSIAATMADYVNMLPPIVAALLLPRLSATSDIRAKMGMMKRAVAGTVALLFPLLAASVALAHVAVRLLFGRAFLPAVPAYAWLAPGIFFLGVNMVAVQFLNSLGYPMAVVWIWAGSAALNIGLNFWVIPRYGIVGASIVSSISYTLAAFANLLLIRRMFRAAIAR